MTPSGSASAVATHGLRVMVVAALSSPINPVALAVARTNQDIQISTYRIASGNRIYSAGDDPAAVSAATRLQSQISTLRQGQLSGIKADSLLQVANDALTRIGTLLGTLEGLTTQADSGALSDYQRTFLDVAFQDGLGAIDSIAATTSFGGTPLLDGSFSPFLLTVGESDSVVEVTIDAADSATLLSGATPNIATQAAAQAALPVVQSAREEINIRIAEVQSSQATLLANDNVLANAIFDIDTARGALVDTDIPRETTRNAALKLQQEVGISVSAQTQALSSGLLDLLRF